ncbi:MAG TPA: flagellar export chaperone FliS [Telluria sp.]|jgi:flagellar protein FliS
MFGSSPRGVNAYAKVGLETNISSASPHKLIVMLYDGALVAILKALTHMKSGNIAEKGKAVSHAIAIIDNGLRASLDRNAGGQIAQSLDSLYDYMSRQLLLGNLENKPEKLEEVQRLLADLRGAWNTIGETPAVAAPQADANRAPLMASA